MPRSKNKFMSRVMPQLARTDEAPQPGNPGAGAPVGNRNSVGHGAPKGHKNHLTGRIIRSALIEALHANPKSFQMMVNHVINKAAEGDLAFIQFLADRVDGKPVTPIDTGDGAQPVLLQVSFGDQEDIAPQRFGRTVIEMEDSE